MLLSALRAEGFAAEDVGQTIAEIAKGNGRTPREVFAAIEKHTPHAIEPAGQDAGRGGGHGGRQGAGQGMGRGAGRGMGRGGMGHGTGSGDGQ